jgi:hypothetical protein
MKEGVWGSSVTLVLYARLVTILGKSQVFDLTLWSRPRCGGAGTKEKQDNREVGSNAGRWN